MRTSIAFAITALLAGCQTDAEIDAPPLDSILKSTATEKDASLAADDCKRRGEPRVGMTAQQAIATCWGRPDDVKRTQNVGGIFDQYIYHVPWGERYLYFQNGIVNSVQTSR